MSGAVTDPDEDAAWVTVETRAGILEVQRFCAKVERLFRLNPYLEIQTWTRTGTDTYRVEMRNLSNGHDQQLSIHHSRPSEGSILLTYGTGSGTELKRSTRIEYEPFGSGSRVRITDDYSSAPASERLTRSGEVDRSLTAWGLALRGYLERERRMGRFVLWHGFLDRVWLPMKPSARRISLIIVWVTLAEIALGILVALIFWLETRPAP